MAKGYIWICPECKTSWIVENPNILIECPKCKKGDLKDEIEFMDEE